MLKTRIIPCLDVKDGRVVKGVNFTELRDAGDPVEQARLYDAQGADELCFLDITASSDNRGIFYDTISAVAQACFMPLTVGGGVRNLEDIRQLLLAGADKVSINTAAVERPQLVNEAAEKFGSQCIVVAIDAKAVAVENEARPAGRASPACPPKLEERRGKPASCDLQEQITEATKYKIFTHGGRKPTDINAVEWAKKMAQLGAGELLLTSMDRDGTKLGVHLDLTRAVAGAVTIPVIASGGIGTPEHCVQAIQEGRADAVLAASVFHYGELTITEVKEAMQAADIPVRLTA